MKARTREAGRRLAAHLRTFPVVLVVGPRQCGKTTLVRNALPTFQHLDLERAQDLARISADIPGFFAGNSRALAIDEAQRLPEIFAALRPVIDERRGMGRFVLTGSASPELMRGVSESLAGRVGILELSPFTAFELQDSPQETLRHFWGGYPPALALRSSESRRDWLEAYVQTFLERDLPALGLRLPAARLRILWTMLTHVHGNLLNVSDLARSIGVSAPTIQSHLDVLEQTFMIRRLPPYFVNIQKRLTKSPKVYVRDTGLLHHLAGIRTPAELETWDRRGASFEGLVIEELAGRARLADASARAYFWGTQAGGEVDLLLVRGRKITAVEIKSGSFVDPRDLRSLRSCMEDLGLTRSFVVYRGTETLELGRGITAIPWAGGRCAKTLLAA